MSVKIKRFHANESNFTQKGRIRTAVEIPASVGITDLTTSKVIFDMHVNSYEGSAETGGEVHIPISFGNGQMVGGPQALIRNSLVQSKPWGLLNERRQQNITSANLDWFTASRAQEDVKCLGGASSNASYGISRVSKIPDDPLCLINRPQSVGAALTIASQSRRAELQVPWRHIDNFANMQQFPNAAIGDLTYTIQLEDQLQTIYPARMPTRAAVACSNVTAVGSLIGTANAKLHLTPNYLTAYCREPKIGDIVYCAFYGSTTGANVFCAQQAEIYNVEVSANQYVITTSGFATTNATEVCTNVFVWYFSPNEESAVSGEAGWAGSLGGGQNVIPLMSNLTANAGYYIGAADSPLTFAHNAPGGLRLVQGNDYPQVTLSKDAFDSIPWYVGAPVQLLYTEPTDSGSGNAKKVLLWNTTISSVEVTATVTKILLKDTLRLPQAGTGVCAHAALCHRDHYNATLGDGSTQTRINCVWTIDEIYLEMHQLTLLPSQMASVMKTMQNIKIPFIDQLLVQRAMPQTTVHADIVQAYANTVAMAVLTPQNLQFLSGPDSCSSYRFSIDGKQQTNQDIRVGRHDVVGRSLHDILLKSFFANIGKTLMKYDCPVDCVGNEDLDTATHHIYPLIVPAKDAESVVQLQLFTNSAATMSAKNIFYVFFVAKQLNISGGRVQVV